MDSLNANKSPSQTSSNPSSSEAVQQTAIQTSRPTPRKIGTTRSTTNVTQHRSSIIDHMKGEMVFCNAWKDGFFKYLPNLGLSDPRMDAEIELVVADLRKKQILLGTGKELRFKDFEDRPSVIKTPENVYFEPLVGICTALARRRVNKRKASTKLEQEPNKYHVAETEGANFKVDGYLMLRNSAMPTKTNTAAVGDLAVPMEYKTSRTEVAIHNNREQLLGTATFCMNDDPRRMHIYGITIEDSTMAVWYFSRSHSAKSPDFDFVEDPRMFIRVLLSLLFANEEELGYDQTVQRRVFRMHKARKLCFVYQVGNRYFKTRRAIFEHRSLCATGRATRVWEAIEVESFKSLAPLKGAPPVVLKDVWLDSGSKTEGDNLREIFDELERIASLLNRGGSDPESFNEMRDEEKGLLRQRLKDQTWKRHFLSILCDWQGLVSKEVPANAHPFPTLFNLSTPTVIPASHPHHDDSRSTTSHPTDLLPVVQEQLPRDYRPKRQYRVVFNELCEVLHDVRKIYDVTVALRDCVFALQLMFVAGWVHRDISSGNIYMLRSEDPGSDSDCVRGILADLEYAKRFEPNNVKGSSDPKTGTAYFMAIEIQKQIHTYNPEHGLSELSWQELENESQVGPKAPSFVIHNFQHDLESIFWILLWTLLARRPPTGDERQNEFASVIHGIFQNTSMCPPGREKAFNQPDVLKGLLSSWLDERLQAFNNPLLLFRRYLIGAYMKRAWNISDISTYSPLHGHVQKMLQGCLDDVAGKDLPELKPCSTKQDPADVAPHPAVKYPTQVAIKRERGLSDAPGDFNDPISKTARVQGTTDVASSRNLCRKTSD